MSIALFLILQRQHTTLWIFVNIEYVSPLPDINHHLQIQLSDHYVGEIRITGCLNLYDSCQIIWHTCTFVSDVSDMYARIRKTRNMIKNISICVYFKIGFYTFFCHTLCLSRNPHNNLCNKHRSKEMIANRYRIEMLYPYRVTISWRKQLNCTDAYISRASSCITHRYSLMHWAVPR